MAKTIRDPLTLSGKAFLESGHWWREAIEALGGDSTHRPQVRRLEISDIRKALAAGVRDFAALRTDVLFLVAVYPVIGFLLATLAFNLNLLHLLFPVTAGFALIGPVAATGLYVMSKKRESGEPASWKDALAVFRPGTIAPVVVLGGYLLAIFVLWIYLADRIHSATLGPEMPDSGSAFLVQVLTTPAGWTMVVVGTAVGLVLAVLVLATSLVSFPMLVDRRVGLPLAVATSLRVARENPGPVACWGAIVAAMLAVGSIPMFLGLILALPILGHATWHLYRAAVRFDD